MLRRDSKTAACARRGAAVVELAFVLPLLVFLLVIGIDFARVYYPYQTVSNCARNGAVYGSQDPTKAGDTSGIRDAALADAGNLSTTPTVTSSTSVDAAGVQYVDVTVTYPFETVTQFPGVPNRVELRRTVRMRVSPLSPFEAS